MVESQGYNNLKLSKIQKEILYLLTIELLTPKQIALRRKTSLQAVYKIINNLKKKGYLIGTSYKGFKTTDALSYASKNVRLHGQEFNIKILYKSEYYLKLKEKANHLKIDDNTIRLYNDSIEIYSKKEFKANTVQEAESKAIDYWNSFFFRLEDYLKILILKEGYFNIKEVKQHYSELNNELAEQQRIKRAKIKIYGSKDGKLWLHTDYSFSNDEIETLQPGKAKQDMKEVVKPFFNDLRDLPNYLPSQTKANIDVIISILYEISTAQLNQTKLIEALLPRPPKKEKYKYKDKPTYVG